MSFLVRKIDRSKWDQRNIIDGEQPSADAITNCMRTTLNTLSLWLINDVNEREEAVLAIASNFTNLAAIDILLIDRALIEKRKLTLVTKPGLTLYSDFKNQHLNVTNLDYPSLGVMAEVIVESIRQKRHKRFRERELIEILTNAVRAGKVKWSELKPDVQKKIPQN
ncbi:MAG: hypothetical protein KJ757_01240 [Planctomycetes bacterium]|nr:hypothetical protein [Planctomycetota bacterium]MBU1518142.1 hypothetical protein [Planctomycetota bacterium]MBU2457735.1 hypothetical protein [Planctomycetota bacterium]MBU2596178.1 hypothetical protein [Planctomycetota bacterium]